MCFNWNFSTDEIFCGLLYQVKFVHNGLKKEGINSKRKLSINLSVLSWHKKEWGLWCMFSILSHPNDDDKFSIKFTLTFIALVDVTQIPFRLFLITLQKYLSWFTFLTFNSNIFTCTIFKLVLLFVLFLQDVWEAYFSEMLNIPFCDSYRSTSVV